MPVIAIVRGRYRFRLTHALPTTCPAEFHLTTYQHDGAACIRQWNAHQKRLRDSRRRSPQAWLR